MFTTCPALLAGIKKGDNVSWYQFRDMYRPLIFHCATECGLDSKFFLELEQDVLVTLFKSIEKFEYDPKKGRFRTYFGKLIHNCIAQLRRNIQKVNRETPGIPNELSEDVFTRYWDAEWKQHIFWLAMKRAKQEMPKKMTDVFDLCDLQGISPCTVAASMKISLATVYNYRSNVVASLRKFVHELDETSEAGQ